ncbi:MAG: hypothetical protein GTN49_05460 [candidate division Zixibacteria bacterium]|nr:hypothetical protein [candidate division Zixibacteria bacterium]
MFGWDIALGLEILVVAFGFILWFKAARAEAGPRKLAKVVAIVVIIFAVLLAVCTVTRAFMYAGEWKGGFAGKGHCCYMMMKMHKMGEWEEGMCPCCGKAFGPGHRPGMGKGMMAESPHPSMAEPAEPAPEEPETE